MYFYHNMFFFMPMPNAAFGSSFTTGHRPCAKGARGRPWSGWSGVGLEALCFASARLLALLAWCCLLLICLPALRCAALLLGCLLVRVCAGRGQPLCAWGRGDKVVSSCWWVRACFIHPETLFQTLSQVFSRRICPWLAPRTVGLMAEITEDGPHVVTDEWVLGQAGILDVVNDGQVPGQPTFSDPDFLSDHTFFEAMPERSSRSWD